VGGVVPLAVEGKALGSPRGGGIGKPVPSGVSSPAEPAILHLPLPLFHRGLSIRRVYCTQQHSSECLLPKP